MNQIDFTTPFYQQEHTSDSLLGGLDSLLSAPGITVRVMPLGCQQKGLRWLEQASTESRRIQVVYENAQVALFSVSYALQERGSERCGEGRFFLMRNAEFTDVLIFCTVESGGVYQRVLQPLIKALHPRLLLTFISHRKLRRLLDAFQEDNRFDSLRIKRASTRFRYGSEHHPRSVMPVVSWPDMELAEAFQWVHENNGWFNSLEFEARRSGATLANVGLTRQGVMKTDRLLLRAYRSFAVPIAKTIHENLAFFGRRGRLEHADLSIRPLALTFDTNVFEDVANNAKFVESMRSMSAASISVVHGNPYIHISLIDYLDGSTFDIWAVEENRLVIVPQMKASIPGIKRLINHIFDNYAEGQMADFEACAS